MTTAPKNYPRRTPTQERARVTHDAILEATARILEAEAESPSTNRIAKKAGVSIGTLYQYFDSREAILVALCRRHADEITGLLAAHAAPIMGASPREAVPAFIDAITAAHEVAPKLHLALTREILVQGGDLLMELHNPARSMAQAWLEHHRAEVRPKDLPAAAFLLTVTVEAAIHGQLMEDPARLGDPAWKQELVDLMLRYLLD